MNRSKRLAGLAGLVAAAIAAAPAAAAPDRSVELPATGGTAAWTSFYNVGFAPTAEVAEAVNCDTRMCDDTLVQTTEYGKIAVAILGNEPTLVDIDLYVFKSNAAGDALVELGRVTDFDADETFSVSKQEPGFFLVRGDWSLGAGSFNGKATFTPQARPTT